MTCVSPLFFSAVKEDDQELTYSDIRVVKKREKRVEQKVEEEVAYGQVKVSKRANQSEAGTNDSMYATVEKNRSDLKCSETYLN